MPYGVTTSPEEAAAEVRAAGYEPLGPYPGRVRDHWPAECPECGGHWALTLVAIRRGNRCKHEQYTQEAARRRAESRGYEPLEPYPGNNRTPWRVCCVHCKRPRRSPMLELRHAPPCPCVQRAKQAEADLRAAGYEPLAPYPGTTRIPWPARCTTCGAERAPNMDTIRNGKRCKHVTPEEHRPWKSRFPQ